MRHNISKLHHWLLKKLIRDNIRQGPHHHNNIEEMLRLVVTSSQEEFTEDNDATQYAFLRGRFEDAIEREMDYHHKMRYHYTPEEGEERCIT